MPTVTLFYGHAYDGKQEDAFNRCLAKIRRHSGDTCLYLVRSEVRVRQLREVVLRELGGCFHFPVTTLPAWIDALYPEYPGARRMLGRLEQKMLIAEILKEREQEAGPQFYFRQFRDHQGILAKLAEFIAGVRRIGIVSPPELAVKLRDCSARRRPVQAELTTVFERYLARLEKAEAIDETGIFLEVARRAAAGQLNLRAHIPAPELLVLEGYYELTPPEQQILTALCAQFERTLVTLDAPFNPYHFPVEADTPKPFRIFREMVRYLRGLGCSVRATACRSAAMDAPVLSAVEGERPMSVPTRSVGTSELFGGRAEERLAITAYRNRKEEITAIAGEIRKLYREGKITALREVGVTFPVLEQYAQLIREIFPRCGVPFTMFQGDALASAPVVVTILRLLEVVLDGYQRETLEKLFASPLVQFDNLDADTYPRLDALARARGIVGGKDAWQAKLTQYQTEQSPQQAASGNGETVCDLLPALFGLLDFLARFETAAPRAPQLWIAQLRESIGRLHIPPRLMRSADRYLIEIEAAALRVFNQLLETLQQALAASARRLTLPEFYDALRLAVQGETYYPPETLADSVWIMGRADTRQARFTYLFFGGLLERDFPGQDEPNIFLSEPEAETFGLPTYQQRGQETAHLFYANLANPTAKLYLSHPLQEGDAELLRSTYLDRVLAALPKKEAAPIAEAAPEASPSETLANIFTYADLYQWLGAQFVQARKTSVLQRAPDTSNATAEVLRFIAMEKGRAFAANFLDGLQAQRLRAGNAVSPFDGLLAAAWSKRWLPGRFANHIYTVAEFDQYVSCPLQFFFQRVLRLTPLPEMAAEIPAPERSKLLHRIVARFYDGTPAGAAEVGTGNVDNAFLYRRTDKARWRQEARLKMERIAQEELQSFLEPPQAAAQGTPHARFSGVFWERFTAALLAGLPQTDGPGGSSSKRQGLLATFVELEADDADVARPCYLDAYFGGGRPEATHAFGGAGATSCILSANPFRIRLQDAAGRMVTIKVKGQIDRIDLEPLAAPRKRRAVVYEYKTGAIPSVKKIKAGLAFQLPLYVLAAQEFLGQTVEVVAGGYYLLLSPDELGKKGLLGSKEYAAQKYFSGSAQSLLDTQEEFGRMLADYQTRAVQVAQAIAAGDFHPTLLGPQAAGCDYCEYQQICRVDHQRMSLFAQKLIDPE